ncbi:MAG: formate dehydrogenase subunit gamma [Burkholderiales bacterium]
MNDDNMIERYKPEDRVNHWLTAITFILLALSGLALFHPAFFWLTNLFGGGTWTRILHPFFGVVLAVSFWFLVQRFRAYNHITDADREWMRRIRDVVTKHEQNLPEVGRFNAGQKYLFWLMVTTIALLLVSGVVLWQPWFAPWFPVGLTRVAALIHALTAFVLIAATLVHIYAGIWVKGSIRAMTRGTVSRAWAKHHHAGWYREMTKGTK